jgi:hypothetical protein
MGRVFQSEEELLFLLGEYDQLVLKCVSGRISLQEFLDRYGDFYMVYALDGRESDLEEQKLFKTHADRIAPHREIWERVLEVGLYSEEDVLKEWYIQAGRLGRGEGLRRLKEISGRHLAA